MVGAKGLVLISFEVLRTPAAHVPSPLRSVEPFSVLILSLETFSGEISFSFSDHLTPLVKWSGRKDSNLADRIRKSFTINIIMVRRE
jgi:hypothetical protein